MTSTRHPLIACLCATLPGMRMTAARSNARRSLFVSAGSLNYSFLGRFLTSCRVLTAERPGRKQLSVFCDNHSCRRLSAAIEDVNAEE